MRNEEKAKSASNKFFFVVDMICRVGGKEEGRMGGNKRGIWRKKWNHNERVTLYGESYSGIDAMLFLQSFRSDNYERMFKFSTPRQRS